MKFLLIRAGDKKENKIFFINTPSTHPPLGLLYLGAILEQADHKVEILDYYMEKASKEQLKNSLHNSDAVGVSIYTDNFIPAKKLCKLIKEIDPNIPLIIGGPHCSFLQESALKDISYADISVVGEGEYVILDIVEYIQGKKKLDYIHGIYYRDNGLIKSGKQIQVIDNLDEVPFPARHLVDRYDYGDYPFGYQLKKKVSAMETSRGCPFHCRF